MRVGCESLVPPGVEAYSAEILEVGFSEGERSLGDSEDHEALDTHRIRHPLR